jgi:hypothetical protein
MVDSATLQWCRFSIGKYLGQRLGDRVFPRAAVTNPVGKLPANPAVHHSYQRVTTYQRVTIRARTGRVIIRKDPGQNLLRKLFVWKETTNIVEEVKCRDSAADGPLKPARLGIILGGGRRRVSAPNW